MMMRLRPLFLMIILISCGRSNDLIDPDSLDRWFRYTSSDLQSNDVTKLYEDVNGVLWIGTGDGVVRYSEGGFSSFSDPEAPTGRINALTGTSDGVIYAGTSDGLGIYEGGTWVFFDLLGGSSFGISALYATESNEVWMGTEQGEIGVISGGSLDILSYNAIVFDFYEEDSGIILMGTFGGLVLTDGVNFLPVNDLPNDLFVLSFGEDSFGTVWMGTLTGEFINILKFENSTLTTSGVNLYNSDDINGIVSIEGLKSGELWLGSAGNGILMYDGVIMRTNFDEDGPGPEGVVQSIVQTGDGSIWVGTQDAGLFKYIPE